MDAAHLVVARIKKMPAPPFNPRPSAVLRDFATIELLDYEYDTLLSQADLG
jgi:hypothetical protein